MAVTLRTTVPTPDAGTPPRPVTWKLRDDPARTKPAVVPSPVRVGRTAKPLRSDSSAPHCARVTIGGRVTVGDQTCAPALTSARVVTLESATEVPGSTRLTCRSPGSSPLTRSTRTCTPLDGPLYIGSVPARVSALSSLGASARRGAANTSSISSSLQDDQPLPPRVRIWTSMPGVLAVGVQETPSSLKVSVARGGV